MRYNDPDPDLSEEVDLYEDSRNFRDDSEVQYHFPTESKRDKKRRETYDRLNQLDDEFLKDKERIYREKLEALNRELEELKEGTHEEFTESLLELSEIREKSVREAELHYRYQVESAEKIRESEVKEAEEEYMNEMQVVQDKMRTELEDRRRKLKEDTESVEIHNEPTQDSQARFHHTRNLRKRGLDLDPPPKPPKRLRPNGRPVQVSTAKESEILEDLYIIRSGSSTTSASTSTIMTKSKTALKRK